MWREGQDCRCHALSHFLRTSQLSSISSLSSIIYDYSPKMLPCCTFELFILMLQKSQISSIKPEFVMSTMARERCMYYTNFVLLFKNTFLQNNFLQDLRMRHGFRFCDQMFYSAYKLLNLINILNSPWIHISEQRHSVDTDFPPFSACPTLEWCNAGGTSLVMHRRRL